MCILWYSLQLLLLTLWKMKCCIVCASINRTNFICLRRYQLSHILSSENLILLSSSILIKLSKSVWMMLLQLICISIQHLTSFILWKKELNILGSRNVIKYNLLKASDQLVKLQWLHQLTQWPLYGLLNLYLFLQLNVLLS